MPGPTQEHVLRKLHHCTFQAEIIQFTFFYPPAISVYPRKFLMTSFYSFTTSYPIYLSKIYKLPLKIVFAPLFPLLHTSISFLHNSSLQRTPFITANRQIRCPGWMPGAVTPSAPPFARHCDYGRL